VDGHVIGVPVEAVFVERHHDIRCHAVDDVPDVAFDGRGVHPRQESVLVVEDDEIGESQRRGRRVQLRGPHAGARCGCGRVGIGAVLAAREAQDGRASASPRAQGQCAAARQRLVVGVRHHRQQGMAVQRPCLGHASAPRASV
jgi:hypothetical protein